MRLLGLVLKYNNASGFGKIAIPSGDNFSIQKENFTDRPEKILKGTALLFDILDDIHKKVAINITPPRSYEDFENIISYQTKNPTIPVKVTITGKSRWGNPYKREEVQFLHLVEYSLHQLFRNKKSTEILEFFKTYFDAIKNNVDGEYIIRYFETTKNTIKGLKLELNNSLKEEYQTMAYKLKEKEIKISLSLEEVLNKTFHLPCTSNDFIIQKLFSYYLKNTDEELHFNLWKNHNHIISEQSFHYFDAISTDIIMLNISNALLLQHFDLYDYNQLSWICNRSDGAITATDIVKKRILILDNISESSIYNILRSIDALSKLESVNALREFFIDKLIELLKIKDIGDINEEAFKNFNIFFKTVKKEYNKLDSDYAIRKFNEQVTNSAKFRLWQGTRYFIPDEDLLFCYISQVSYDDFISASISFHHKYFHDSIKKIAEFNSIENFCLLTFLIVETPYIVIHEVFSLLEPEYQASYWMNFPKEAESYTGRYHEATYKSNDIPFTSDILLSYLQHLSSIEELIISYDLVKSIQSEYKTKTRNKKEGFRMMDEDARKKTIKQLISQLRVITNEKIVDFLQSVLNKSNNNAISIFKAIFPLTEKISSVGIIDLIQVLNRSRISEKCKQGIFIYISKQTSKYNRIHLWLKGYIKEADFDEIIEVFNDFQISEQPMLLRKLFSLIHKEKQLANDLYLNKILPINKCGNVNFNVGICLAVLKSLKYQDAYIEDNIISEIISEYVKENISNLVQIDDLFEECLGRTHITKNGEVNNYWYINIEGKDFLIENDIVKVNGLSYPIDKDNRTVEIEGEILHFKWRKEENQIYKELYERPDGITFCDARYSQIDEALNKEYWWCCNKKCYEARQNDHIHLEWRFYSLRDFIKILGLSFEEDKYYRFLGVLNRANRLMSKLRCQSCKQLLRDAKSSRYAFYRVTTFHCTNPNCSEKHNPVYLSHCLNWHCLNIVDSRVSTTCPNGWYICDSCGSCCSHDKLVKRLEHLKANSIFNPNNIHHQELQSQVDNKLGHMEKGERFDYKTGLKNE